MIERQVRIPPDSQPESTSPEVNSQDLEYDARPETRVDNAGVKVKPRPKKSGPGTDAESEFQSDIARLPPD